ncbi:MAG: HDIG domain-containing metalloprotein, partial [Acidimicrobiia bacterium]
MASWSHLAQRFFGALRPGGPKPADVEWVRGVLEPPELALWERLPAHDRRHTVEVARKVESMLAGTPNGGDPRWPAAALLHDVGKLASNLSVYGRVVATLMGMAGGWRLSAWEEFRGFRRRIAQYLRHAEIGADMIRMAGGREEVAAWAYAHHDRSRLDTDMFPASVVAALV